jgi:hypothetical protein
VGEIICRVPNGLHRIWSTWWERAVGAHQIQPQVGNFLGSLSLSLDASSCLVQLGYCVKDFPCLWRDSHHDWGLKSLLSVATGFQGQMMWLSGLPTVGCAIQISTLCSIKGAQPSTLLSLGMYVPNSPFPSTKLCNCLVFGIYPSQVLLILLHVSLMCICAAWVLLRLQSDPVIDDCRYKVVGIYYPGCDDDDQLMDIKPRYSCQICVAILGMKL